MSEDEKNTNNESSSNQDGSMKDVDTAPPFVTYVRSFQPTDTLLVDPKVNTAPVLTKFTRLKTDQSKHDQFRTFHGMRGKVVKDHLHVKK